MEFQHIRISPAHPRVHLAAPAITEKNKARGRVTFCGLGLQKASQLHLPEPVTCELCLRKLRARNARH